MNAPNPVTLDMTLPMEVGICCEDLNALLAFYTDVLGFELVNRVAVPPAKAASSGLAPEGYEVARLQTPYGERLKLLQPQVKPLTAPRQGPILKHRNTTYLTFIVRHLASVVDKLAAQGVQFDSNPARMEVRPGTWLAFFRDPEGNILELVEYDNPAEYRPDIASAAQ